MQDVRMVIGGGVVNPEDLVSGCHVKFSLQGLVFVYSIFNPAICTVCLECENFQVNSHRAPSSHNRAVPLARALDSIDETSRSSVLEFENGIASTRIKLSDPFPIPFDCLSTAIPPAGVLLQAKETLNALI